MDQNHPEAAEQRSIALVQLMGNPAAMFYAAVCLSLKQIWSDTNKTAWTNGTTIGIWPEFWLKCTSAQQIGLLLHETLHVAFFHMFRGHSFDPFLFNMACDYVINLIIIEAGFELPPGALIDYKYKGWSCEQVARDLVQQGAKQPEDYDLDIMPPEPNGDTSEAVQAKVNDILVQASMKVSEIDPDRKCIPEEIRRYIDLLTNPPLPWTSYLARYFKAFQKRNNNWSLPNKKYYPQVYLPRKRSLKMGKLNVYVDASGSLTDSEFNTIISSSYGIMRMLKPEAILLTSFNTKLGKTITLKSRRDFESLDIKGKGGTSIHPVLNHIAEEKPTVSVIFTDGLFDLPEELPKSPIIWAIINNEGWEAPCGKVINIEVTR